MADSGWVDVKTRYPEAKDADATKRVLCWHALNGCMMLGWMGVKHNTFITHWQTPPEGPEGHAEIAHEALYGEGRFAPSP